MNTHYIWNNFSENILAFIEKRIKSKEDALDIRQEVFIKVHLKSRQIQDPKKLTSWIYQIARNIINDYYRHYYKERQEEEVWKGQTVKKEDTKIGEQESFCCLQPFLDELPEKYKIVMLMHYQQGIQQNEIAHKLGISISGIKSRIQRAREILKSKFSECCGYHSGENGQLKGEQDCPRCHHI